MAEQTRSGAKAVDIHAHLYPRAYLAALEAIGAVPPSVTAAVEATLTSPFIRGQALATEVGLDRRLELMDAAGIAVQVLSLGAPEIWHPEPVQRTRLSCVFNDGLDAVCRTHPERFRALLHLPLPSVDACLEELERAGGRSTVVGVGLPAHLDGGPIDDPELAPVLAALDAREAVVVIHPDGSSCRGPMGSFAMEWALGAVVDDTIAAVRVVYGLQSRYPRIRWVIPHLGGVLPAVLGRLDEFWAHEAPHLQEIRDSPPSRGLQQLYFDTVTSMPEQISVLAARLGGTQLLLGSDLPYRCADGLEEAVRVVRAAEVSHEAVLTDNAVRLLPSLAALVGGR